MEISVVNEWSITLVHCEITVERARATDKGGCISFRFTKFHSFYGMQKVTFYRILCSDVNENEITMNHQDFWNSLTSVSAALVLGYKL